MRMIFSLLFPLFPIQLLITALLGVIVGAIYFGLEDNAAGIQNRSVSVGNGYSKI